MPTLSFLSPEERERLAGETGELAVPTPALLRSAQALSLVRRSCAPASEWEVRFPAAGGLAWATAAAARQDGALAHVRVVVEVSADDAALGSMPALDAPMAAYLNLQAARLALRDAHAIEGDPSALQRLRDAGLPLAAPRQAPRWDAATPPSVSAVVTHKDLGRYLPDCIASLRAQTVPVEIVLVDDGSGAAGLAAVAEEERKDPAIRVIRQPNQGLSAARNAGVEAAGGEWVLIVDADNVMRPGIVSRLLEAVRCRGDAEFAVPAFRAFHDATGAQAYLYCPSEVWAVTLLADNTAGDACALHRRETLRQMGGFRAAFNPVEDWDLWLRYAGSGRAGAVVPEVLFDYRLRGDSMMRALPRSAQLAAPFGLALRHEAALQANLQTTIALWGNRILELITRAQDEARGDLPRIEALQENLRAHVAEVERLRDALRLARQGEQKAAAEWGKTAEVARQTVAERDSLAAERDRLTAELQQARAAFDDLSNSGAVRAARALRSISPGLYDSGRRLARRVLSRK